MDGFIAYLDSKIEEGKAKISALEADGRRDDAVFMKVHTNIYEICRTVTRALMSKPGCGNGAVKAQMERFRREWSAALEKAKQHEDTSRTAVEETKLAALDDIIAHFDKEA